MANGNLSKNSFSMNLLSKKVGNKVNNKTFFLQDEYCFHTQGNKKIIFLNFLMQNKYKKMCINWGGWGDFMLGSVVNAIMQIHVSFFKFWSVDSYDLHWFKNPVMFFQ